MTEAKLREVPTTADLLAEVREGVAAIVRAALAEAERLREEADEKLQRYDATTGELARLRLELHALKHELADLPPRVHVAALDGLVPDGVGEDAEDLQRRYVQARERAPVVEARIGRLEAELSNLRAGGDRPAQVNAQGGERRIIKHNANSPALDALNEAAATLQDLHEQLETVIPKTGEELLRTRDRVRDGQNQLWGLAKARR
jgi:DNA repair exonuclease SbcCD ATPase subunit